MNYAIYIERYAQKQIMQLNKIAIPVLKNAIETLGNDPRPFGYIKLKGEESYRIKVGDYRIIYEIEMPGVASIDKVNLSVLEEGIEVKAIGDRTVYQKFIDVVLPLKKYELEKDLLTLELGLK